MTKVQWCAIVVVLSGIGRVDAHQLDELVQAARLDITRDRVVVELTLSPGVAVVPHLLQIADRDRDARLSPEELHELGLNVIRDLTLVVDGRHVPLSLTRAESSSNEEFTDGMGAVRLRAESAAGALARGRHRVRFENAFEPGMSVYLANALKPSDRSVAISAQHRDRLQRLLELDVEIVPTSVTLAGAGLLAAAFVVLVGARRRRLLKP